MIKDDIRDKRTEAFYRRNQVAEEYEEARFKGKAGVFHDRLHKGAIASLIHPVALAGKRALDVGCGTGRISRYLKEMGARVTAIDTSHQMLAQAMKQKSAEDYIECTALRLPFRNGSFDLGVSVNVLNHLSSYEGAIDEICRVSKEVVLGLPNRQSLLVFAYLARILKGWGTEYSGLPGRKYEKETFPYSRYFSFSEIKQILEKNGMNRVEMRGCWILPFFPDRAVFVEKLINRIEAPLFRKFGTFFAIRGSRER